MSQETFNSRWLTMVQTQHTLTHKVNLQHQSLILRDSSPDMFRQTCIHASFPHSVFLENVVKPLPSMWGWMGFQSQNCHLERTRLTAQRREHGIVGKIGNLALCLSCIALIFSHQELQQRIWGLRITDAQQNTEETLSTDIALEHSLRRYTVSGITCYRETSTKTQQNTCSVQNQKVKTWSAPVAVFYAVYYFCLILSLFFTYWKGVI